MVEAASALPPAADRWSAWDSFLEMTARAGFMQSSWWADFRADAGYEHFAAILKSRNAIIGGALVQKYDHASGNRFYYIQDGPVVPEDETVAGEVFEAILEEIEERRKSEAETVSHLRMEPRWERLPGFVTGFQRVALGDRYVEPRNTLCVDLRPSEAEILAQMKRNGRYNIGVARRHGVSIVEDTSDRGLADFLSIYQDTADRKEFAAKPPDYFQTLITIVSRLQRGAIFFAEHQGKRLAAAVVLYFGRRATYFYAGSLAEFRHVKAADLLQFEIMRRAKELGYEWYDLWGIAPENEPDHPWQNITAFKRKFGGTEINFVPTLDHVYDAAAYERYVAAERNHDDD